MFSVKIGLTLDIMKEFFDSQAYWKSGTREPGPLKWDPGLGATKFSSGTQDPGPLKRNVNV